MQTSTMIQQTMRCMIVSVVAHDCIYSILAQMRQLNRVISSATSTHEALVYLILAQVPVTDPIS